MSTELFQNVKSSEIFKKTCNRNECATFILNKLKNIGLCKLKRMYYVERIISVYCLVVDILILFTG